MPYWNLSKNKPAIASSLKTIYLGFGRNSFELFQQVWPAVLEKEEAPESQIRMARALTDMQKGAYSSTLKETTWKNTTIVNGIDSGTINSYKQADQKGLLTIGSPGHVASLTEMQLMDDYYFCVQPLIAGNGNARPFDKLKFDTRRPLKLVGTRQLKTGVLIVHYSM